uniref:Uncharacterized protein n=1 Tax=Scleropages formosus TaxID=113540 RepID=A0A8C9WE97_SCLFO
SLSASRGLSAGGCSPWSSSTGGSSLGGVPRGLGGGSGGGSGAISIGRSSVSSGSSSGGISGKSPGGGSIAIPSAAAKGSHSSSVSGGLRRAQGSSSSPTHSPVLPERKTVASRSVGYEGTSSENSSPEYRRKEYASAGVATRGRSENRESEIRARLQSASPSTRWTELDDVKRLLKGSRSSSISPPRSPSSTLPIPKKASVELRSGQYESATLDPAQAVYMWNSCTLPSSSYSYQMNPNNLSPRASLLHTAPVQGLQNNLTLSSAHPNDALPDGSTVHGVQKNLSSTSATVLTSNGLNSPTGYGVQKNTSQSTNGSGTVGTAVSTSADPSSPQTDDVFLKDYKFLLLEKENGPAKKDAEILVVSKDSGKQFTASTSAGAASFSEDSIRREKMKCTSSSQAAALRRDSYSEDFTSVT